MAPVKLNPLDITWVKINPVGETIDEDERAKREAEKQRNVYRKTVAARPWRAMCVCVTFICVAAFILVNAAWIYSEYFPPHCVTPTSPSSSEHEESSSSDAHLSGGLSSSDSKGTEMSRVQFVEKREWSAFPAQLMTAQSVPVPYVIVSQTFTHNCYSLAECSFQVRFMQQFYMQNQGWPDIIYNFVIGGDGRVYVGRGWDFMGDHTFAYNERSIGVAFIGTFDKEPPSKMQLDALRLLIENGIGAGKLTSDCKLMAKRQVRREKGKAPDPGDALYEAVKTLPHWSADP